MQVWVIFVPLSPSNPKNQKNEEKKKKKKKNLWRYHHFTLRYGAQLTELLSLSG